MSEGRAALPLSAVNNAPAEPAYRRLAVALSPVLRAITKQDWRGGENIPREGGVIIVANHISDFDPVGLAHFLIWHGRWPRALGKSDIWKVPVLGKLATALGQIPVERNSVRAKDSLDKAAQALERGECVVIFPEGTITADPDTWPMTAKPGAARLAFRTGAPVVPVGQWGANYVMPGKKPTWPRLFPRKTMMLKAGPPIPLADLAEVADVPAAVAEAGVRIMDTLTSLVSDLRGIPAPAERYDIRRGRRLPRDWARESN